MTGGTKVEDRVQELCERLFFPDFTVRSPSYSKSGGRQKEAADLLVPFDNRLLIFQIKTKQEKKPVSEKSHTDFDRIRRKVDDAVAQVRAAINAVRNQRFDDDRAFLSAQCHKYDDVL